MQLWKKISLICSFVLIITVAVCGTLLLVQSKNNLLEQTYKQTREKQYNLAQSFSEMANYFNENDTKDIAAQSAIRYCFSRFADSSSVLMDNESILYSEIVIDPQEYCPLPNTGEQKQYEGEIMNRNIIIVGSKVIVQNQLYSVYVVEDISTVYNDITTAAWNFLCISIAIIAVGVIIIILLVKKTIRPLAELRDSTERIASGQYKDRVTIHSNDEIGELAENYNRMADAIEAHIIKITEAADRQRTFMGNVTHEYKTPLTTIILHTKALKNNYMSEEQRERSLSHIERQSIWLERLTQKLLKLITVDKQLDIEEQSVCELIDRVKESTKDLLNRRNIILKTECSVSSLKIDMDLMQSALVNLVDNAAKASNPGQTVYLRAYNNIIEVQDYGCGISEEELTKITEPFYMSDNSRSKKDRGSGLGLALVKEIVTLHHAELKFKSTMGKGTVVRIMFFSVIQ